MPSSSPPRLAAGAGLRHHTYCRKQKSLGLLCSNFVSLYNRDGIESVGLDDAARRLGVERRRIYDIVNVMESVGVLARKAKNKYSWIGFSGIPKALDELKEDALREISGSDGPSRKVALEDDEDDDDDDDRTDQTEDDGEEKLSQTVNSSNSGSGKIRTDNRKEKSLGSLTQNFVKLFLTADVDTVSLDEAARLLLGDINDASHMRTKVRRLYDIANVLSSMNLIEKVQVEARKPAFRWLGAEGKPRTDNNVTVAMVPTARQSTKRAFGTDITNADLKRSRLSYTVDKNVGKMKERREDLKECNLTAQKQLGSKKGYVFGPFRPVGVTHVGDVKEEKGCTGVQDWKTFSSTFQPQYRNQALSELFTHYLDAWKSWYVEVAQESSKPQHPFKKSLFSKLL